MSATPHVFEPEYFTLRKQDGQGLLPASRSLVIDPLHDMALLIDWQEQRLVSACTFFEEELLLLLPILRAWPACVPYGRLLALLEAGGSMEHDRIEAWKHAYAFAVETGTQGELLAPLRARLAEPQQKLAVFGLKLAAVYQTGIVLSGRRETHSGQK